MSRAGHRPLRTLVVICAYNEENSIATPVAQAIREGFEVLVVDDGSEDRTSEIAKAHGAEVIRNDVRGGKALALSRAISYAKEHEYEAIIEVGADAVPVEGGISRLYRYLTLPSVGGVSARQIPLGSGPAYRIDELMWSILAEGKSLQQRLGRQVHLGAVMYGAKLRHIRAVAGVINDDEFVGILVSRDGGKNYFAEDCVAYFDASSSIKHLFNRRKRMILGHLQLGKSTAPSMQPSILTAATLLAIVKKTSRLMWLVPALIIEIAARLSAFRDSRKVDKLAEYVRWHTHGMKKPIQRHVT
ncbi:MAG: glycosyltransferase [Nitrososphaerota archaeon]|nr:glycosyltransferase [Candidatus Calditenuaceae archaeon]MDW8073882.1 glycosyltransferase [Nitrososphaerota archaeon]